jgi:hypothetical protein
MASGKRGPGAGTGTRKGPAQQQKVPPSSGPTESSANTTVVISKSYLDQLLKASVATSGDYGGHEDQQPVTSTPMVSHTKSEPKHLDTLTTKTTGTLDTFSSDYFPFGRPGCGAPLRSGSGQVLADLRQRTKIMEAQSREIVETRASHKALGSRRETGQAAGETASPHYTRRASTITAAKPPVHSPEPDIYFPFGRPGCGAPLRSESGQVLADLRLKTTHVRDSREVHVAESQASLKASDMQRELGQVTVTGDMASPRYARGAGPHVSDYLLKEREGKRKKELEHVVSLWFKMLYCG